VENTDLLLIKANSITSDQVAGRREFNYAVLDAQ